MYIDSSDLIQFLVILAIAFLFQILKMPVMTIYFHIVVIKPFEKNRR